ncbi:hypothetical protein ACTHGU_12805 [Chitinophagaceae bacterium MMS25-I14]
MNTHELTVSKKDLIALGSKNPFDLRKAGTVLTALILLGGIGYLVLTYVLPWMKTVVWNAVSLGIGIIALIIIIGILTNKKFWRRLSYLNDALAKIALGWVIEFDEFILQEKQIEQAEQDRQRMFDDNKKIKGKYAELSGKVIKNKESMQLAQEKVSIARNHNDMESAEDAQNEWSRANTYVETIEPIVNDLNALTTFIDEAYKIAGRKVQNAKLDLEANKDLFYSANLGAGALASARKAFVGDTDLNSDAEVAKAKVKEKIALSIGEMRSSIDVIKQLSKAENLENAAKIALAKKKMEQMNKQSENSVQTYNKENFNGLTNSNKYGL